MESNKKLTVIDFFCGAGGFSEGFRQLGYKITRGYDHWQPAIDTFNHNFQVESTKQDILEFCDINKIHDIPDTDVIIGSPPCVSFSTSNKSGKADKSTGIKLIKAYLRVVAVKKFQKNSILKAWFMENVPNSRKHLPESFTFAELDLSEWAEANQLEPTRTAIVLEGNQHVINSADYGSFQARKRVFSGEIILLGKLPIPTTTHSERVATNNGTTKPWKTLGELLKKIPAPDSYINQSKYVVDPVYPELKVPIKLLTDHFYDSGLYFVEWNKSLEQKLDHPYMGKMSFPENLDKPSRTVTATKSGSSRESLIYKSELNRKGDGEFRTPTIREAASIMGFPYTYQFKGSIFNKWRLVGNAVCPAVSRAFAEMLLSSLQLKIPKNLLLTADVNLDGINNLNDFKVKTFNNPPRKAKNSKFRRHLFKDGNMTVTLANYNIKKNSNVLRKWQTSIEYGTGIEAHMQIVHDNFYKELENLIESLETGKGFLITVDEFLSNKIAKANELQKMLELQKSIDGYIDPVTLIQEAKKIILNTPLHNDLFTQEDFIIFKHKRVVPTTQLLALYLLNKIATLANRD